MVDDNADAADSLAEIVRLLGHDVEVSYDGPSAISKVRKNRPDVLLCDVGLPGVSGTTSRRRCARSAASACSS